MKKIKHPTGNAVLEVPDEKLSAWVAQGWQQAADKPPATTPPKVN